MKKMSLKDYSSFLIKEDSESEESSNEIENNEANSSGKSIRITFNQEDIKEMNEKQASKYLLSFDIFDAIINDKTETDLQRAFVGELLGGQGGDQKLNVGKTIRLAQLLKVGGKGLNNPQKYLDKLDKSMTENELQGQQQKVRAYIKIVKASIDFLVSKEFKGIRLENKNKVIRVNKASYIRTVKRILSGATPIFSDKKNKKHINLTLLLSSFESQMSKLLKTSDRRSVKKQEKAESEVKSIVNTAETFDAFWDKAFKAHMQNPKLQKIIKDESDPQKKESKLRQSKIDFMRGVYGTRAAVTIKKIKNTMRENKFDFVMYILTTASFQKESKTKDPNRQFGSRIKDDLFIDLFKQLYSAQISNETMQKILTQVNDFYSADKNVNARNVKSTKEYKEISRLLAEEGKTVTAQSTSEVSFQEAIENSELTTMSLLDTSTSEEEAEVSDSSESDDGAAGNDLEAAKRAMKVLHDHITKTQENYNRDKLDISKQDTAYESNVFKRMAAVIASSMSITNLFLDEDVQSIEELLKTDNELSKIGKNLSLLTHPDRLTLEEGTVGHAITEEMQKLNSSIKSFFETNFINKTLLEYLDFDTEKNKFKVKKDSVVRVFKELINKHKDKELNEKLAEDMLEEAEASFGGEIGGREAELMNKIVDSRGSQAESEDEDDGIPKINQVEFFKINDEVCISIDNLDDGNHISLSYWKYIPNDKLWQFSVRDKKYVEFSKAKEKLLLLDGSKELNATSDIVANILKDAANDSSQEEGQKIARKIADELRIDISKSEEVSSESQSNKVQYIKAINIPDPLDFGKDNSVAVALAADMFLMLASSTEKMSSAKSVLLSKATGDLVEPSEIQKALEKACNIEVDEDDSAQNKDFLSFCNKAFKKIGTSGKLSLRFLIEDTQITDFPLKKDALQVIFTALAGDNDIVKISEDGKFQTFDVKRARLALVTKEIITSQRSTNNLTTSQDEEESQETGLTVIKDTNGDGESDLSKKANQLTTDQTKKLLDDLKALQDRAARNEFQDKNDELIANLTKLITNAFGIKDVEEVIETPPESQIDSSEEQQKILSQVADEVEETVQDQQADSDQNEDKDDEINLVSITSDLKTNGTTINSKLYADKAYPLLLATGATALRLAANLDFEDIKKKIFNDQEKISRHTARNISLIFHPDKVDNNKALSEDQKEQLKPLYELFFESLMIIGKSYNENNDSYGIKFEFANYDKEQQKVIIKKSDFEKACNDVYSKYIKREEASLTDIFNDINKMFRGEEIDTETEEVVSPVDGSEEIQKSEEEKKEDQKTYTKLLADLSQIKSGADSSLGMKTRNIEDLEGEKNVAMTYEEWLATDNITKIDSSNLLTKPINEIVEQDDFDAYTTSGNSGEIFHEMVTTRVGESNSFNDRALLQSIKKVANENELKQFLKNATDDGKDRLKVKVVDIIIKNLVIKATLDAVGLNKISGNITENFLKKVTGSKLFKAAKLSAGIGGAALSLGGLLGSAPIVAAVGSVAMGVFASMSIMKRLSSSLTFKKEYEKFSDDPVGYISKNFIQDKKYQNKVLKPIVNNLIAYQATICVYKSFKGNAEVQSFMSGKDKSFENAKEKFNSLPEEKQEQIRIVFNRAFKLLQDCPWHFQSKNNAHAKMISQGSINILFNELFFGEDPLPEDIINKISSGEGISGLSEKESSEVLKKILEVLRDKTSINSTIVDFINDSIKHHCGIGKGKFQSVKDFLNRKNRAKFIQDENQSFNIPRNILTATQKGLDSLLDTDFGSEKESKSFLGDQELEREKAETAYDALLLKQISNCKNEKEYNERYQSKKVSENFASYKNLIKNNSLSYLLFEADSDEVASNLETPQPSQPQDVEIVPTDLELVVGEVLFKPAMAGLRGLMSLFAGLADSSAKSATKVDIDIADVGAQAATAGKAATTTTETADVFYESLDKASSVLSKGKDAVSRVLELPNGKKMICYFSNKAGDAAEKMSAIIYDPASDSYQMIGRMKQIEKLGWAKTFKLDVAQSVAEGKFVLSASSQAMPVPMDIAMQDIARASEEVFGSITQKITSVVQKASVSEVPPAPEVSNISADMPSGSSFEGGIEGAQTQGWSGKMSQEQANRVFADFLENPEKLDETLEALKNRPQSVLNPSKPMEIEPAAKIVTPEDTTITKTIVKKLNPPDSTQGLDLQTGKETYTFKTPGSGEAGAGKAAGAGTGSSEAGAGAGKAVGGDAGQTPLQVPPTQIPDWLSTAKSASFYVGITNGIHSAYERSNFKVIRGGIFGKVFFQKYSPSKIIAVDVFDALKGGAPTSTRSLTKSNVSLPTATDNKFLPNGDLQPGTQLGIEGPNDNEMSALETPSIIMLGSDNKPQGIALPSPKNESYVHNISLKDFMFENKVVIKNKRKW